MRTSSIVEPSLLEPTPATSTATRRLEVGGIGSVGAVHGRSEARRARCHARQAVREASTMLAGYVKRLA